MNQPRFDAKSGGISSTIDVYYEVSRYVKFGVKPGRYGGVKVVQSHEK
jgi:hypothetical protein